MERIIRSIVVSFTAMCVLYAGVGVEFVFAQETVGTISPETTQVYVRLAGPFPLDTQMSYSTSAATGSWITEDGRSGKRPINCFPGQIVVAHVFLNVNSDQQNVYNSEIETSGGITIPISYNTERKGGSLLTNPAYFQPNLVSFKNYPAPIPFTPFTNVRGILALKRSNTCAIVIPKSSEVQDGNYLGDITKPLYLGAFSFQVNSNSCSTLYGNLKSEVQPLNPLAGVLSENGDIFSLPQLRDLPDRISDMLSTIEIPDRPQLIFENMQKLHLIELCLGESGEQTQDGIVYTSNEVIISIADLKNKFGWDFAAASVNIPVGDASSMEYSYNISDLFPFAPFKAFVRLPYHATPKVNQWVPSVFSDFVGNDIATDSYVNIKFVEGSGLSISYKLIDKVGGLQVDNSVMVMLSFDIPSRSLPNGIDTVTGPIYAIRADGAILGDLSKTKKNP